MVLLGAAVPRAAAGCCSERCSHGTTRPYALSSPGPIGRGPCGAVQRASGHKCSFELDLRWRGGALRYFCVNLKPPCAQSGNSRFCSFHRRKKNPQKIIALTREKQKHPRSAKTPAKKKKNEKRRRKREREKYPDNLRAQARNQTSHVKKKCPCFHSTPPRGMKQKKQIPLCMRPWCATPALL